MTKLLITLCFSLILLVSSCQNSEYTYKKAQKLLKEQKYSAAIEVLDHIIASNDMLDSAYLDRAYAYRMLGDVEQATKDYTRAAENPVLEAVALTGRGTLYFDNEQYAMALDDYSRAIELDENNDHIYYYRGLAKAQMPIYSENLDSSSTVEVDASGKSFYRDYIGALEDFNRALELNPRRVETYVARGNLFQSMSEHESALKNYNHAVDIDPSHADAYFRRALHYKTIRVVDKSLADFDKALHLDPNNPIAYVNRGHLKKELNDHEGACKDYKKAEQLDHPIEEDLKAYCQ